MTNTLLKKTRKINMMLQKAGGEAIDFAKLAETLCDTIEANCYIISKRGKVLGNAMMDHAEDAVIDQLIDGKYLADDFNHHLLQFSDTEVIEKSGNSYFGEKKESAFKHKFMAIVPIKGRGERQGTLLLTNSDHNFDEEDIILAEFGATVVALEIFRSKNEENEEEARRKAAVQIAVDSLSYSEIAAMKKIFENLDGNEGFLVASKIADEAQITRSVIVNALRKLESAGVIQSRSLGMKGTYIKILNEQLKEEFVRRIM